MMAGQEAPEAFRLLAGAVDPAVDRLGADRPQADLDPEAQPSGDLLGRPAFGQAIRDVGRELRIRLQPRPPLAARAMYAPSARCGRYAPLSSALRPISREIVEAARPSARAIA